MFLTLFGEPFYEANIFFRNYALFNKQAPVPTNSKHSTATLKKKFTLLLESFKETASYYLHPVIDIDFLGYMENEEE